MENEEKIEDNEESVPDIMDKFFPVVDSSPTQIDVLQSMYDPVNIKMKSRVVDVMGITRLTAVADYLASLGLNIASKTIMNIIQNFLELMVSKDGLGRIEAMDTLKGMHALESQSPIANLINNAEN